MTRTVEAARIDLGAMHGAWMALAYPRKYVGEHSVVENWTPPTTVGAIGYRIWAAIGLVLLLVLYPLNVVGLAIRYYARRLDRTSASLGVAGVVGVSLLAWGLLTAATYVSPIAFEGFVAVAIAGVVATASAVCALFFTRRGGRASTVALGYPFAVTALFLPPVVAALYSPTVAAVVFPRSESLAIWILDNLLSVGGLAAFIRTSFELQGLAYVGMWFGLAVPLGWALGLLVTYVNVVRPAEADAVYGVR